MEQLGVVMSPIGDSMRKWHSERGRRQRELAEKNAQLKETYARKYGLDDLEDWQVTEIARAEKKLELCAKCTGECLDPGGLGYCQPIIEKTPKGYGVPYALCKWGLRRRLERACRNGLLPRRYLDQTFSDYELTEQNREAVGVAKWFLMKADTDTRGIYYYGGTGAGKTFLASLIAKAYINSLKTVIFGDVPTLLDNIKKTFDTQGEREDVLGQYAEADLLILDDLGVGNVTEWNVGVIYQIVNRRYNTNLPLIVTSNYAPEALQNRFSTKDSWSAKRIVSRLQEMCIVKSLGNVDRRVRR